MPGLAVLPGRGRKESLAELLAADPVFSGIKPLMVHRIDADTSGLIVFARTPESHKFLAEQFRLCSVDHGILGPRSRNALE